MYLRYKAKINTDVVMETKIPDSSEPRAKSAHNFLRTYNESISEVITNFRVEFPGFTMLSKMRSNNG